MILNIKGGDNVARCEKCSLKNSCFAKGEFVGSCIAEKYLSMGGNKYYSEFKSKLVSEINFYLKAEKIPEISELFEIPGEYINLKYPLESGEKTAFLRNDTVFFGNRIEFADLGVCFGAESFAGFILICSCGRDGSDPELILYKRR